MATWFEHQDYKNANQGQQATNDAQVDQWKQKTATDQAYARAAASDAEAARRKKLAEERFGITPETNRRSRELYGTDAIYQDRSPLVNGKVYVPGVNYDRRDFEYGGVGQGTWDARAQQSQSRGPAQLDQTASNWMRGQQKQGLARIGEAADMYAAAARGEGPSVAQAQLQQGVDRSIAAQAALANAARGGVGARAAAMRGAALAGDQTRAQAVSQAAALRAQEIDQARQGLLAAGGAYGQAASQARGQDLSASQADLQAAMQQRNMNDDLTKAGWLGGLQAAQSETAGRTGWAGAQRAADLQTQIANANLRQGYQAREAENVQTGVQGGIGALGAGLGVLAAFSDKRVKTNIKDGGQDADAFMKSLSGLARVGR